MVKSEPSKTTPQLQDTTLKRTLASSFSQGKIGHQTTPTLRQNPYESKTEHGVESELYDIKPRQELWPA